MQKKEGKKTQLRIFLKYGENIRITTIHFRQLNKIQLRRNSAQKEKKIHRNTQKQNVHKLKPKKLPQAMRLKQTGPFRQPYLFSLQISSDIHARKNATLLVIKYISFHRILLK